MPSHLDRPTMRRRHGPPRIEAVVNSAVVIASNTSVDPDHAVAAGPSRTRRPFDSRIDSKSLQKLGTEGGT